jgi:hypothetical protein
VTKCATPQANRSPPQSLVGNDIGCYAPNPAPRNDVGNGAPTKCVAGQRNRGQECSRGVGVKRTALRVTVFSCSAAKHPQSCWGPAQPEAHSAPKLLGRSVSPKTLDPSNIRTPHNPLRGKQKGTAMPELKTPAAPPVNSEVSPPAAAETVAPLHPLKAAKNEMGAAIDDLLLGYSRVRVARVRDALDLLRAAIPSRPPTTRRKS